MPEVPGGRRESLHGDKRSSDGSDRRGPYDRHPAGGVVGELHRHFRPSAPDRSAAGHDDGVGRLSRRIEISEGKLKWQTGRQRSRGRCSATNQWRHRMKLLWRYRLRVPRAKSLKSGTTRRGAGRGNLAIKSFAGAPIVSASRFKTG